MSTNHLNHTPISTDCGCAKRRAALAITSQTPSSDSQPTPPTPVDAPVVELAEFAQQRHRHSPRPPFQLTSKFCVRRDFDSDWYRYWQQVLNRTGQLHRKEWELAAVIAALDERGLLQAGQRGLGFGVGDEPLPAIFAACGCQILATDAASTVWNMQDFEQRDLNLAGHCPPKLFAERVRLRRLDMNRVPRELRGFDFTWSTCSVDHLGSVRASEEFLYRQMECLRPGGWAIHTAEYTLSPGAPRSGPTVYFTHRDLLRIARTLQFQGDRLATIDWNLGDRWEDHFVDQPPWPGPHLKLWADEILTTSVLLIAQRGPTTA